MYDYGAVGNCQINALINDFGGVEWLCLPQPDSPPVFGKILDQAGGEFSIVSRESDGAPVRGVQAYLPNTNILETVFTKEDGASFKITDFCPRFEQHGRMYRPPMLIRVITPLSGAPSIQVNCAPADGWKKTPLQTVQGNSHIRFEPAADEFRLATNMPLTHLNGNTSFALHEKIYLVLSWGLPFEADLSSTVEDFLRSTEKYWTGWVKHCSIPTLFQKEVIRSALVLKLHCYEATGAILASLTTSLPEEKGHVRNWDYRCCWVRDAYFSLSAFHNLGHFEEMEGFIRFMLNIAQTSKGETLHPVYKLDGTLPLPEIEHLNWDGFAHSKPVRTGNDAATHVQNDVYGEMVLSLAPIFFDERFRSLRSPHHVKLVESLANQCIAALGVTDAGLWEFRNTWSVHTFSTLLCWAGIERVERMAKLGLCKYDLNKLAVAKKKAEELLQKAVVDGSARNADNDPSFDASLAMMAILRYPDKELNKKTVLKIYEQLTIKEPGKTPAFFYRYIKHDDFGKPASAFLACSFWAAISLATVGEKKLAEEILVRTFEAQNKLGLYAEHFDPVTQEQLGNFPQAYSHVGLINTAFAISPPWTEIL